MRAAGLKSRVKLKPRMLAGGGHGRTEQQPDSMRLTAPHGKHRKLPQQTENRRVTEVSLVFNFGYKNLK